MGKYRKKPVVIEAFQMTKERRWNNFDWPNWLHAAWNTEDTGGLSIDPMDSERERLYVGTVNGPVRVEWDDWIIQGVEHELYPCRPDIFEATYEDVAEEVENDEA